MINKEVDGEQACDPRLAAMLAAHLVSQVLDEAFVIANATAEKGEKGHPWHYQSMLKNFESDKQCDADDEDTSFEASKGDSDIVNENKIEHAANVVATLTPEKVTDDLQKNKPEPNLIGQGDEELDLRQNELTKSTSMFINHLFDMSEVEKVIIFDETEIMQNNSEPNELLTEAMNKIMESYVNTALGMTIEQPSHSTAGMMPVQVEKTENSPEPSEYSFLTDAFAEDISKDVAFYIHDDGSGDVVRNSARSHLVPNVEIRELCEDDIPEKLVETNDVARYENAFLSLNRDYEQNSEDEVDPILEDPKGMTLQEVELMTADTSEENLSTNRDEEPHICPMMKELVAAESGVSAAASGSKKGSLVSRCRSQGARLLACIRGWWRRRTPGKRKENRVPFAARGLCPLSPDARRRAASLLDQRLLRSPSPNQDVVWKFNTVNESFVHSSRWKGYTFDVKPDECGEY
ncbi:uncharacterized protein LOC111356110 isoform X1 [Spodoptera litura]|uniref:Uncharacterized protein LOC111356110 isoform X1 n=2 Tax=Spodoptera litura TaxID=69820 RepID=A0A9J7E827_SPOLT|nr:uncharacterized protein LOC111356110 isoform X1 [Spodoptera litura]